MNRDKKDLIAFGDEHNDTEMLAFAGKGYAMKNANPELLPYADEQISLTNDQDGVAKTLQDLFLQFILTSLQAGLCALFTVSSTS